MTALLLAATVTGYHAPLAPFRPARHGRVVACADAEPPEFLTLASLGLNADEQAALEVLLQKHDVREREREIDGIPPPWEASGDVRRRFKVAALPALPRRLRRPRRGGGRAAVADRVAHGVAADAGGAAHRRLVRRAARRRGARARRSRSTGRRVARRRELAPAPPRAAAGAVHSARGLLGEQRGARVRVGGARALRPARDRGGGGGGARRPPHRGRPAAHRARRRRREPRRDALWLLVVARRACRAAVHRAAAPLV